MGPQDFGRAVFNNGDHVFFYRHNRPTKLQQTKVADIKRKKFEIWTSKWADSNLSERAAPDDAEQP